MALCCGRPRLGCILGALALASVSADRLRVGDGHHAVTRDISKLKNQTLISSRFNQYPEKEAFELYHALKKMGLNPSIVQAVVGEDFGVLTMRQLEESKAIIVMASDNYGQIASSYSTYYELRYAWEHGLTILPIQLSKTFPPQPPGDERGAELCKWALGESVKRIDWSNKRWNAQLVAKELKSGIRRAYGWPVRYGLSAVHNYPKEHTE
mmetsp:Transcript_78977/g.176662  ORF Transcript_78977/g.176662 Transcript_78977/m.176662 type:complete len:210 (-) Transcript_78977:167-796(-)